MPPPDPPVRPQHGHIVPPEPGQPAPATPIQAPQTNAPFTSCDADAREINKLPKQTVDLASYKAREKLRQLDRAANSWFAGLPAPTLGTAVPYIYGRCAFQDIADALATAVTADDRIYVAGWWVEPWTRLLNPLTGPQPANPLLQDYLRSTKAQVRGLFWNSPIKKVPGDNAAIVQFVNSLPNGAAIEDDKLPKGSLPDRGPAAHHQKLVVVCGRLGLIAFLGGMDLNNSRVDVGGFSPLHDVHLRLTGPPAIACLRVFRDRWLDHAQSTALDQTKFKMTASATALDFDRQASARTEAIDTVTRPGGTARPANVLVSIGKTYARLTKFSPGQSYAFAPNGEQSAWQTVQNGISQAKRWIYIEDQYLVSRRAREQLLKKLKQPSFEFLLILMGNSYHFEPSPDLTKNEFPYLIGSRNEFRDDLMKIDPGRKRWRMFILKPTTDQNRRLWCGDFVHSKLWICDDDFVAIGSANCDDRGYTYDSEIMAGITDAPLERAAGGRFARDLRIALWRKHLGVPHSLLQNFSQGLNYWLRPPATAMITDASDLEDSPLLGGKGFTRTSQTINHVWTHLIDPDADKL